MSMSATKSCSQTFAPFIVTFINVNLLQTMQHLNKHFLYFTEFRHLVLIAAQFYGNGTLQGGHISGEIIF